VPGHIISEAQERGYAENNSTDDVDGPYTETRAVLADVDY
jgi:homoserine dehydrogenase